jgi:hypothetical protein
MRWVLPTPGSSTPVATRTSQGILPIPMPISPRVRFEVRSFNIRGGQLKDSHVRRRYFPPTEEAFHTIRSRLLSYLLRCLRRCFDRYKTRRPAPHQQVLLSISPRLTELKHETSFPSHGGCLQSFCQLEVQRPAKSISSSSLHLRSFGKVDLSLE